MEKSLRKVIVSGLVVTALVAPAVLSDANTNVHAESWKQFGEQINKNSEQANKIAEQGDKECYGNYYINKYKKLHNDRKSIHYYYYKLNKRQGQLRHAERKSYDHWAYRLRKAIRYNKDRINKLSKQISYLRKQAA